MSSQVNTNGKTGSSRGQATKTRAARRRKKGSKPKPKPKPKRISRLRKPAEMSLEAWQVELRRQYGREQDFKMKNVGREPIFSEFEVTNPQTERTYRVAIRGQALGENYCSCPDFAVNTLGTCKHVEFVLAKLGRKRGAKTALALGFQSAYSEVYLQYGAKREVVFRPGIDCPKQFQSYARRYFDQQDFNQRGQLKDDAYSRFHLFMRKAGTGSHEVRCHDDAIRFIAQVRDGQLLRKQIDKAFPRGVRSPALNKLLKTSLYPYQKEGTLFAARTGRCLIADDMGLGKTIQAIAAAEILAQTAGIERVLVISPTSLKHQWQQEIEKFTDRDTLVVEGLSRRRAELYRTDSFYKLTNYDVIYRDLELIEAWQPDLIILDEAQRIKNWKTRTAQAVKQLQSEYAFVLTGTPLENRLEELHSIVEFIDRHRLGPMFRFLAEHQHVDENGRVVGYRHLSKITETLEPILVRRTKEKVLDELPERMDKRFFVPMTPQQMDHHEENRETVARIVHKWRRYGFLSEADQLRLRISLQNMRMSCNSTYLLDHETDHGVKADEVIDLLSDLLEESRTKVVIFSQWLRMHELVIRRLEETRWGHVMFHGGVPSPKRRGLIQQFKEDDSCRLFLSTDAGGVGLNLQNASAVINLDQPWNPAVLEQRVGRVHRLGQHRPVTVAHFISQGTIEEGMLGLLAFKKSMFTGVLDGGKDEVFLDGTRLGKFMESVEKASGSIPPSMPQEPSMSQETERPTGIQAEGLPEQADRPEAERKPESAVPASEQVWSDVLAAGMTLLEKFGQAVANNEQQGSADGGSGIPGVLLDRDQRTGQSYLKLPLPEPDTLRKIVDLVAAFGKSR